MDWNGANTSRSSKPVGSCWPFWDARWRGTRRSAGRLDGGAVRSVGVGIVVEAKEKIKESWGRSPDYADAVALVYYRPRKFKLDVYLG